MCSSRPPPQRLYPDLYPIKSVAYLSSLRWPGLAMIGKSASYKSHASHLPAPECRPASPASNVGQGLAWLGTLELPEDWVGGGESNGDQDSARDRARSGRARQGDPGGGREPRHDQPALRAARHREQRREPPGGGARHRIPLGWTVGRARDRASERDESRSEERRVG